MHFERLALYATAAMSIQRMQYHASNLQSVLVYQTSPSYLSSRMVESEHHKLLLPHLRFPTSDCKVFLMLSSQSLLISTPSLAIWDIMQACHALLDCIPKRSLRHILLFVSHSTTPKTTSPNPTQAIPDHPIAPPTLRATPAEEAVRLYSVNANDPPQTSLPFPSQANTQRSLSSSSCEKGERYSPQ